MVIITVVISIGAIVGLYMPFWQHGAVLDILKVTPTTSRDINSVYAFIANIYANICGIKINDTMDQGSFIEAWTHHTSTIIFCLIYGIFWIRSLLLPHSINTQVALIRWMALAWLLFCIVGSPWFWPWYSIVLFGFFALLEIRYGEDTQIPFVFGKVNTSLFGLTLSISLFSLYCFGNLSQATPQLQLSYLGGIWIWGLPCLVLYFASRYQKKHRHYIT